MMHISRWHQKLLGRSLLWAGLLGGVVLAALVTALFCPAWANRLKDFQIALGGLGALAAALAQHDGATASVRDARRKEGRDREELRRTLIIQCHLDSFSLHHICLNLANNWARVPPKDNAEILRSLSVVPQSKAIERAWENVTLFSDSGALAIGEVVRHTMAIANIGIASTSFADAPVAERQVRPESLPGMLNTLRSAAEAAKSLAMAMADERNRADTTSDR